MCLCVCGKILSIENELAYVDILGIKTLVNIVLIEDVKVGDYVLIHTGFAIEKVSLNEVNNIDNILFNLLKEDSNDREKDN